MSMSAFAERLGAAERTVARWSSQGDGILLRADMQAALDTVLTQATPDVRERFEALRTAGGHQRRNRAHHATAYRRGCCPWR